MWVRFFSVTSLLLGLMLLVCKSPSSTPGPESAFLALEFKSSSGNITQNILTDTLGKQVTICLIYNNTLFIDASMLKITIRPDSIISHPVNSFNALVDTIFYPIVFSSPGSYTVTFSGYIDGQPTKLNGIITIVDRPQITPKPVLDTVPPAIGFISPSKDTIIGINSISIKAHCKDPSGIRSLIGTCNNVAFDMNKTSVDSIWSGELKGLVSGSSSIVRLVAMDSSTSSNIDSVSVKIKYDGDTSKPVLARVNPATENAGTNSSSYSISLTCSDSSGVSSVNATLGSQSFTGTRGTGNNWTIAVSGLVTGSPNAIVVTATDSSMRANKSTLNYAITFNPTMLDTIGPTFTPVSGPASGTTITTSNVDLVVSVTDPNGVDSVYWMKNSGTKKMMTTVSGKADQYLLNDTLAEGKVDTLTLVAVDKATMHNQTKLTITLKYSEPRYSVTYNGNSNTGGIAPTDPGAYVKGALATVASTGTLTKTGYTFDGWNTTADGSGTSFIAGTGSFVINSNITLFAKWKIKTYTLSYNGNGNSSGTAPEEVVLDSNSLVTATSNTTNLSKTGFDFNGWNTKADGSGTILAAGATFRIKSDTTLYAQWIVKKYTLTISAPVNGTVNQSGTISIDSGAVTTITATPASGFKFKQWSVTSGTATIASPASVGTTIKLTQGNATIQAEFVCITFAKKLTFSQYAEYSFVDCVQTEDGGYLVVGNINNDLLLVKLNMNGDTVWTKTNTYLYDPHSINKVDIGYIISGFSSGVNTHYAEVLWYAQNGNNTGVWGLSDTSVNSSGYATMLGKENGYIVVGELDYNFFLTKLDNSRKKTMGKIV
jgi:uncharacterized repeat protein (TIGR02543 family)